MIITFAGHKDISGNAQLRERMMAELKNCAEQNLELVFYCGGYGSFDSLAAACVGKLRKLYSQCQIKSYYVTPYLKDEKLKDLPACYDGSIYPEIEKTPLQYAILKRNEWMVDQADLVIAYVRYSWGGAAKTLEYAQRKKKKILNLYL